ncbi:hypothetical protein MTP99_010390 [Tenebrio molitor]|nr:hypothetical protein MTP99_010390 [Tenebrio molitor]
MPTVSPKGLGPLHDLSDRILGEDQPTSLNFEGALRIISGTVTFGTTSCVLALILKNEVNNSVALPSCRYSITYLDEATQSRKYSLFSTRRESNRDRSKNSCRFLRTFLHEGWSLTALT